jgi:polyisoprenoid-binding protein YceI
VIYDPAIPRLRRLKLRLIAAPVNSGELKRDSDLKTAEFFEVKCYPVMKYKSKRVDVAGPGKLKVTGG